MSLRHVSAAVSNTGVRAEVLNERYRRAMVIRLLERLGVDVSKRAPWDGAATEGKQTPDGWELIPKYIGANVCLMFLEGADAVWKFQSGRDLMRVLNDCPPLEFYVCDEDASYLLCHNHHDFVMGWGAASRWVEELGSE
jgi:hypothetical protein